MKKLLFLICMTVLFACESPTIMAIVKDGESVDQLNNAKFVLYQNYPNPFNPTTSIEYKVYAPVKLQMNVYTEDWQKVATIVDGYHEPKSYQVCFSCRTDNNDELPSGEYFYTLEGDGVVLVRRMKLVK